MDAPEPDYSQLSERQVLEEILKRADEQLTVQKRIDKTLATFLSDWQAANGINHAPVSGHLSLTGGKMGLTVDTTPGSESVSFQFDDDDGNPTSAPTGDGSGIVCPFSTSDDTLATVGDTTVGADSVGNPVYTAPVTVVTTSPATVDFSVAPANEDGGPLTEDDGSTPFPAIASLSVPITAGDPVTGSLSVAASPSV